MLENFLERLKHNQPNTKLTIDKNAGSITVAGNNPEIQQIVIHFDDEITVEIGKHFHCHFDPATYDPYPQLPSALEAAVEFVMDFLSDKILLWVAFNDDGLYQASGTEYVDGDSETAKAYGNLKWFTWSGEKSAS